MPKTEEQFETITLSPSSPNGPAHPHRRRRRKLYFFLIVIVIVVLGYLLYKAEKERSETAKELEKSSAELEQLEKNNQAAETPEATDNSQSDNQELAQEVLTKLRNHIVIPDFPKPTVATIMDVDTLKKVNSFYEPAANGDYLIITEQRAILYDSDRDLILDIVPIQANQEEAIGPIAPDTTPITTPPTP